MIIVAGDLPSPQIAEFLREHVRQMRSSGPQDSDHSIDIDRMRVAHLADISAHTNFPRWPVG